MKIGDWVMVVPHNPMIDMAKPYVGHCSQILSGPHLGADNGVAPDVHYDIGININPKSRQTYWWVKHLMPIDPPEEVKNEETTKQETPDEVLSHD